MVQEWRSFGNLEPTRPRPDANTVSQISERLEKRWRLPRLVVSLVLSKNEMTMLLWWERKMLQGNERVTKTVGELEGVSPRREADICNPVRTWKETLLSLERSVSDMVVYKHGIGMWLSQRLEILGLIGHVAELRDRMICAVQIWDASKGGKVEKRLKPWWTVVWIVPVVERVEINRRDQREEDSEKWSTVSELQRSYAEDTVDNIWGTR